MPPTLFLLGATGYIGGDFLYLVNEKHPDWIITALVRNSDKGATVAKEYPAVRLIYGDLDSAELIEEEASKADIVLNFANCDHEAAATAIVKGLGRSSKQQVFYIHTSGTGILTAETFDKDAFGDELTKSYDDWDGIKELWSLPDHALHRKVDKIVQGSWSDKLKSAIVCPPTIYGQGRGPDNQRSVQADRATASMLKHQKGWTVGKGKNVWHQIHVHDLSDLYLHIAEAAANGGAPATWNDQGYYLAENGEFVWGDIAKAIARDAHSKGLLPSPDAEGLSTEQIQPLFEGGQYYVGTNSRGVSKRGKQLFGWKPHRPSLLAWVPSLVDREARTLGLTEGHAAKVAA
ncbi:uncharacterized protein HMPREF1541_05156 [Cyphellophora europaea CBS 101466]|uniref:Semialdehyde dehydrogenase NAD-binding domain-containing protein n=1 Tax=Cyphellophora europaea (strain CBS 101466) TaxID=1220924 RepID=W2RWN3_CYPE1|nr:uncharacterized protein HMPREF1541_05156 [Cyphellophora europaea CBS 101466]ETN40876.1 hypothetical protein HMPREF1541_05156 [Cyphellophora europaea CBS 101466]